MKYIKRGDFYALRLDKGEEIIEAITAFCKKEAVTAAFISGIGAVNYAEIGCYSPSNKEYHINILRQDLEILSLTGNLTTKDGSPYIHIHISLANSEAKTFGGHLDKAVVSVTCEIAVQTIEAAIEREYNSEIGINLMKFKV